MKEMIEQYREDLLTKDLSAWKLNKRLKRVTDFIAFIDGDEGDKIMYAGKNEVEKYSRKLIEEEKNSYDTFLILREFSAWLEQWNLYTALIDIVECDNTMQVLSKDILKRHGQETLGKIFHKEIPPLGADEKERYAFTKIITAGMSQFLTPEESESAWFRLQHGIPASHWKNGDARNRKLFRECKDIDTYLETRGKALIEYLTRLKSEGKPWYSQELDGEVLEFITQNPEIEAGKREGDRIFITKIPYQAKRYLHETDPVMKRYHACHCPLVREGILRNETIAADICRCSLGHASHYLSGLGKNLQGEVLESVIRGDTRCRFVFYLDS